MQYIRNTTWTPWVLLLCLCPTSAMATLGELETPPSSYSNSAAAPAASRLRVLRRTSAYKVREQTTSAGGVIREYINNSGIVFAVSWKGSSHPDLTTLLGRYTIETAQAHREHRRQVVARQAVSRVETPNIVYQRSGHMGDISGLAYVPVLLPAGVVEGELHD